MGALLELNGRGSVYSRVSSQSYKLRSISRLSCILMHNQMVPSKNPELEQRIWGCGDGLALCRGPRMEEAEMWP